MRILLHMGDPYLLDNPCTKRMRAFKEALEKKGHTVVMLAPDTQREEVACGVVYCKTFPLKKKTSFYRLLNSGSFALSSIKEAIGLGRIDIVLTTCPPPLINLAGFIIARQKRAKLIYDVRDIWPDVALEMGSFSKKSIYYHGFAWIKKFMLKQADLVTAVSSGKVKKLTKEAAKTPVILIENGFDKHFGDSLWNDRLAETLAKREGFKCIYVGNLGLAQGVRQLLQLAKMALNQGLKTSFIIYGSGAEEAQLIKYAARQRLTNVYFEGRLPHQDMYTVLKSGDMSFVPLVNGNLKDSIPTKMYESLGCGCPVLLAAQGDSVKVLEDTGFGVFASPYERQQLWKGFCQLYHKDIKIMENQEKAVTLMKDRYSLQTSAEKLAEQIEQLTKGKR